MESGGASTAPGKRTLVEQLPSTGRADVGGLGQGATEDQDVGGRTVGEAVGDAARPVGTALGNAVGSIAGALTGITISSATTSAAVWKPHGFFHWEVAFTTSGRSGWLVQEVRSTRRAQNAKGAALPDGLTRHYWEAWAVNSAGAVTPSFGAGSHDQWQRRSFGKNTQGHWSMTGAVHFTKTDPATMGFTTTAVPEAGGLLATTSAPTGLGVARLHRYAQGTWDSTTAKPTHTGSAH